MREGTRTDISGEKPVDKVRPLQSTRVVRLEYSL